MLLLKFWLEFLVQAEDVLNEHKCNSYTTFLLAGTLAPGMVPYVSVTHFVILACSDCHSYSSCNLLRTICPQKMPRMCKLLEGQAFLSESISAPSSLMITSVVKPTEFRVAKNIGGVYEGYVG